METAKQDMSNFCKLNRLVGHSSDLVACLAEVCRMLGSTFEEVSYSRGRRDETCDAGGEVVEETEAEAPSCLPPWSTSDPERARVSDGAKHTWHAGSDIEIPCVQAKKKARHSDGTKVQAAQLGHGRPQSSPLAGLGKSTFRITGHLGCDDSPGGSCGIRSAK